MRGSMKMVRSGEVELATEAWGEPTKGTILLAMGATASMVWWPDSLMERLAAAGYRAIRFDHRDTGQSTTSAPGDVRYDIHDLAGDLTAILDAYGADKAHLVGMSLGGYVSQLLAVQQPERVQSLTLMASEPLGIDYPAAGISDDFMAHFGTMQTLDWTDHDAVAAFLLRIAELSAGSQPGFERDAAMVRIERELARTSSMQSAFNHSMVGGELEEGVSARALKMPVLVIHGSEDPVISVKAAETTVAEVTDAKPLLLEGRGHELLEADVPAIAAAILEHVAG